MAARRFLICPGAMRHAKGRWPGGILSFVKWEKGNIKRENGKHKQVPRKITFKYI